MHSSDREITLDLPIVEVPPIGVINDRYELRRQLHPVGYFSSRTPMNMVYKAWDRKKERWVVVIIATQNHEKRNPFLLKREAIGLGRLHDHPNVVSLLDFGEMEDTFFIVLEFVIGESLSTSIPFMGSLPVKHCISIGEKLLGILEDVHQAGLVHQDLKPENLMITSSGVVVLIDFGLVRFMHQDDRKMNWPFNDASHAYGTPFFLSPEQARNQFNTIDHRSDLFSCGVILHEMLTGKFPFTKFSEGEATVMFWANPYYQPFPEGFSDNIPLEIKRVVRKALDPSPRNRYRSAQEMRCELLAASQ